MCLLLGPCPLAYTQGSPYTVTVCTGTNIASGVTCTGACATGYTGTAIGGSVTCTNGAYVGSYTGCGASNKQ